MSITSLRGLFVHELQDLYSAEQQLSEAIPRMSREVRSGNLKRALDSQLETRRKQQDRISRLLQSMNETPGTVTCAAMKGLISEGDKLLRENSNTAVRDAAIIGSLQRAGHYGISAYGTARAYAEALGEREAASLLQTNLDEENEADQELNGIAFSEVNPHARDNRDESVL